MCCSSWYYWQESEKNSWWNFLSTTILQDITMQNYSARNEQHQPVNTMLMFPWLQVFTVFTATIELHNGWSATLSWCTVCVRIFLRIKVPWSWSSIVWYRNVYYCCMFLLSVRNNINNTILKNQRKYNKLVVKLNHSKLNKKQKNLYVSEIKHNIKIVQL